MENYRPPDSRRLNFQNRPNAAAGTNSVLTERAVEASAPQFVVPGGMTTVLGGQSNRSAVSEPEAVGLVRRACGLPASCPTLRPIVWIHIDVPQSETTVYLPREVQMESSENAPVMRHPVPAQQYVPVASKPQPLPGMHRGDEKEEGWRESRVPGVTENRKPAAAHTLSTWNGTEAVLSTQRAVNEMNHSPGKAPWTPVRFDSDGHKHTARIEVGSRPWLAPAKDLLERDVNREQEAGKEGEDGSNLGKRGDSDQKRIHQAFPPSSQRPAIDCSTALVVGALLVVGSLLIVAGLHQRWSDPEFGMVGRSATAANATVLSTTTTKESNLPGRYFVAKGPVKEDGIDSHSEPEYQDSETSEPNVITMEGPNSSRAEP